MAILSVCDRCREPVGEARFRCDHCGVAFYESGTKEYWLALREELGDDAYEQYIDMMDEQRELMGPDLRDRADYEYMCPSDPWGP